MGISIPSVETVRGWVEVMASVFMRVWTNLYAPVIGVRLLPPVRDTWNLEVRNVFGGVAIPRVFVQDVVAMIDGRAHSTGDVTSDVEVYRSESLDWIRLSGASRGLFAILSVDRTQAAGPRLRINTVTTDTQDGEEVRSRGQLFINSPAPLAQQAEFRLEIRVDFYDPNDPLRKITDKAICCSVHPVPGTGQYVMRVIKSPRQYLISR
jgi:hypothetical protein